MQSPTPNSAEAINITQLDWRQYCALAARTESIPACTFTKTVDNDLIITRLLHAVLGIATELAELADAITAENTKNIIEEVGDAFWYLAIIENTLMLPKMTAEDGLNMPTKDAAFWLGELQDVVKRAIFYGEELFTINKKGVLPVQRLTLAFYGINYFLQTVNNNYVGKSQAYYFETNIKKLAKRYPELIFKSEDALERNVEKELSHILDASADSKSYGHDHEDVHEEEPLGSGLMGRVEFNLANLAPPAISAEDLFDNMNTHEICTQDSFNHFIRETYTTDQIEKLAMTLAFNTAAYYRSISAFGIARAYDDLYKQYSGKGDKLEDYSCYVMWRDLGYSLQKNEIVNKIAELRL